jgi:phosphoribosylformylglycinamidine cyclo-ligase
VGTHVPELGGSVGEALLVPHRSYLRVVRPLLGEGLIKGMAHITGGGITENLPRILPEGTGAVIRRSAWDVPAVFRWLQASGDVPEDDMLRTFNMGIGLIVVVAPEEADRVLETLVVGGEGAHVIGEVVSGESSVTFA